MQLSGQQLARANQKLLFQVLVLAMCRGRLPAVIARLMSKCLSSGWKWIEEKSLYIYIQLNSKTLNLNPKQVLPIMYVFSHGRSSGNVIHLIIAFAFNAKNQRLPSLCFAFASKRKKLCNCLLVFFFLLFLSLFLDELPKALANVL